MYHISSKSNLKVLFPKVSTHGTPYVYGVEDLSIGLLFVARKDDFDLILRTDNRGKAVVYECYKNSFEKIYKGVSCSIYEVEREGFVKGITGWEPEYVNDNRVNILTETYVEDLHSRLVREENEGNLTLHRYEDSLEYKSIVSDHIVDRLIRFKILDSQRIDERVLNHFGKIIEGLIDLRSGRYL